MGHKSLKGSIYICKVHSVTISKMIFVIVNCSITNLLHNNWLKQRPRSDQQNVEFLATVNVRDAKHAWRMLALHDKRGAIVRNVREEMSLKDTNLWRVTNVWDWIRQGRHRAPSTPRLAAKRPVTYKKQVKKYNQLVQTNFQWQTSNFKTAKSIRKGVWRKKNKVADDTSDCKHLKDEDM